LQELNFLVRKVIGCIQFDAVILIVERISLHEEMLVGVDF
jgi:hypothetical protein